MLQYYCESGFGSAARSLIDAMALSDMAVPVHLVYPVVQLLCWQGQLDTADSVIAQAANMLEPRTRTL